MLVTNVLPDLGVMVSTTNYTANTTDLLTFSSNPLVWRNQYLNPTWNKIITGNFAEIGRVS